MLLTHLLSLRSEVFKDCSGLDHGGQRWDVGDGGVVGKDTGTGVAQETVILGLERHFWYEGERRKSLASNLIASSCAYVFGRYEDVKRFDGVE